MRIHCTPHSSRKKEAQFLSAVLEANPAAESTREPYLLPSSALEHSVDTMRLAHALGRLPNAIRKGKRLEAISHLEALPRNVHVALSSRKISFDFVIDCAGQAYFVEYHERQHASFSVNRSAVVYDSDGTAIRVPRFVQRLVRDVWRIQAFGDVTIVWDDWFVQTGSKAPPLKRGFHEYSLPGRFALRSLVQGD